MNDLRNKYMIVSVTSKSVMQILTSTSESYPCQQILQGKWNLFKTELIRRLETCYAFFSQMTSDQVLWFTISEKILRGKLTQTKWNLGSYEFPCRITVIFINLKKQTENLVSPFKRNFRKTSLRGGLLIDLKLILPIQVDSIFVIN